MKKHAIISAIATVGILLVGPSAVFAADITCTTQGPNSPCTVKDTNSNTSNCDVTNNVDITNQNNQNSGSGNANSGNNTTSGNVGSGDASATNSSSTGLSINNGCGGTKTTPQTPVTPVVPQTPATPAVVTTPVVTPQVLAANTVKALPDTGINPMSSILTVSALAGAAVVATKFGASVLSRR